MAFLGRHDDLTLLDQLWNKKEAAFLILYGRRRVGKTSLLTHWLKTSKNNGLYWVAEPSSIHDQLRSFSQAIYNAANPESPAPPEFSFANWAQALQQVAILCKEQRVALFIDEFTYLLAADPSVAGTLQNVWDHYLKQDNLLLVICGSHLGMMQRHTLSYQAPLYGRATAQIRLQPLPFGITKKYFPTYQAHERAAIYSIWGGIPAYWERIDQSQSVSDNIRTQLLNSNNLMQSEPRLLLQDFVSEPHNYVGVLRAIANNARTQKEISNFSGLQQGHASKYLGVLQESGFVERRVPVTQQERSRQGRYHITDPYLRFYYRFLSARQAQLAMGVQTQVLAEIQSHFLEFIGTHTWEEICREWTLRASVAGDLSMMVDHVGSAWTKHAQVDVVGINNAEKQLILGECKWSPKASGRKILSDLIAKTSEIVPKQGEWTVAYLGFARGGWTGPAKDFADEVTKNPKTAANWKSSSVQLIDLDRVDIDMQKWTGS